MNPNTSSLARQADLPHAGMADNARIEAGIDLVFLSKQTLCDKDLENELLRLFAQQARSLVKVVARQDGKMAGAPAEVFHMLCGSARAVGAWAVADLAMNLERCATGQGGYDADLFAALQVAVEQTCAVIEELLSEQD